MTVNFLQIDHKGQERISSMWPSPEEKETMQWLLGLEEAAPGITIFVHRLSGHGHYLCTVPCKHPRFAEDIEHPPRYCGCFTCIDQRNFTLNYTAWILIPNMQEIMQGISVPNLEGSSDVLER